MARSLRIEYAGAAYHVVARGYEQQAVFLDDDDRRYFVDCVSEICQKTGWNVHAWVVMPDHYHLFVETPEPNLVRGMKSLQNLLTHQFLYRYRSSGKVFGDRYKSVVVDADSPAHYAMLWKYLHLNPARLGLINYARKKSLVDYPWTSLAEGFALPKSQRPDWLASEQVFKRLGYADTAAGRRKMVGDLDLIGRREKELSGLSETEDCADLRLSNLRRGWYLGSREFGEKLRKMAHRTTQPKSAQTSLRSSRNMNHGDKRAKEIVLEGLQTHGLRRSDLSRLSANDPRKVEIALQVWNETTATQKWIAEQLFMKTAANVSLAINRR